MMKLSVEITTTNEEGKICTFALAELLYNLHRLVGAPDTIVLQGPPGTRTVIWSLVVHDRKNNATLQGEIVTTPADPQESEESDWAGYLPPDPLMATI